MTPHHAFFGDAEHAFRLTGPLIIELEGATGTGIGALCGRVFNRQFAQADISETIRLALIGGGTTPKRAAEMIAAYVVGQPLVEPYTLAAAILESTMFGHPHKGTEQ